MSQIEKTKFKHRPKREYLRNDTKKKSGLTTWLLRLLMYFMLLLIGMFLIAISSQIKANENKETTFDSGIKKLLERETGWDGTDPYNKRK